MIEESLVTIEQKSFIWQRYMMFHGSLLCYTRKEI